jgi:hypothetical protein
MMDARDRAEARLNLAMLPAGVVLVVVTAVALVAVLGFAIDLLVVQGADWPWYFGWSLAAAAVALRNLGKSFETMSALDVPGTLATLAWSAAIVVAWPGWWLG